MSDGFSLVWVRVCTNDDKFWIRVKEHYEKVYFRSQILERPSIGEYWNIFGVPVVPENMLVSSRSEQYWYDWMPKSSNTRVTVSGTWSTLFF